MTRRDRTAGSRRGFLKRAGLLAAIAGTGLTQAEIRPAAAEAGSAEAVEPFYGAHQGGILTPAQRHTYFTAFDLDTRKRADVIALLLMWTEAAALMSRGEMAPSQGSDSDAPADIAETMGLSPSRLTITFGFGPGLFIKNGKDRYGLGASRPPALIDMPAFTGDQLLADRTGGDISVQACADDPQVAFHAIRRLSRLGTGIAQIRWGQTGFLPHSPEGETPRNLMGFKDGTGNPSLQDGTAMEKFVFTGDDGPAWMRGGSYVVARRILIALEHWDRMRTNFQEQTFGRHKLSGAPLGKNNESDTLDFEAADKDGNPRTPINAHVRLAAAQSNGGARVLRRPYSYNDGVSYTAERWPPWRQGIEYDAGLFFICYQRDPREGFVRIYERMSKLDLLNQFSTHTGGGMFACPPGAAPGEYIGQKLFET
ncbi:MAG TPA: iron uptake transporter deferrochelatase/peroxidase subunit [Rhizomicrobium sp.]|nr:iron uptake transporter deferrochelatase/peroxidase subunit [Rhizomicrobium sp.]